MVLCDDICRFLAENALEYKVGHIGEQEVIYVNDRAEILPATVDATCAEEAEKASEYLQMAIQKLLENSGRYPLVVTEDRWNSQPKMMHARLLAHLQIFTQIYARNCEVRKIDKKTAADFLAANHSYGDAACRYRYGLFLKRYTGHTSSLNIDRPQAGDLVAVATFSNGRKWIKGDKTIRSYEWTRYASLPGVRLSGGMGKLLQAFIEEVQPDDIMTYADLEWSEGKVYEALGFTLEGVKSPVLFSIDIDSWQRKAHTLDWKITGDDSQSRMYFADNQNENRTRYLRNLGSNKYRLKLTDYQ